MEKKKHSAYNHVQFVDGYNFRKKETKQAQSAQIYSVVSKTSKFMGFTINLEIFAHSLLGLLKFKQILVLFDHPSAKSMMLKFAQY